VALRSDARPSGSILPSATSRRGDRPIQAAHIAGARVLGAHTCACLRSPRAIAHWLLARHDPAAAPTELALDREEAALWSMALTGRLRIEHAAVDGTCALQLVYSDGERISITMDELRSAATATAA
jgi:hypothetical protein